MDEDLDPEVLAAIEASKHEAEEEDLLIKAALEESIRESTEEKKDVDSSEEPSKGSSGEQENIEPILELVEEQKNVENGEDDPLNCVTQNNEELDTDPAEEHEGGVDRLVSPEDISKIKENGNSEETNGHNGEDTDSQEGNLFSDYKSPNAEETDGESNVEKNSEKSTDGENKKANSPSDEIRLEGEPVIDEDPFKNDDTGDPMNKCKLVKVELSKIKCDPSSLPKNGVKREAGSESEDDTALSRRSRAAKSSGKRKRSASSSESDSDSAGRKSLRPRGKSKGVLYRCPFCPFNSELIGELNIHKYNCKEGQAKPSFLDLAEVIISSCPGQTGIKKDAIFERLQKDYSEYLTGDKKESLQMLSRALEGGAQKGRIRKAGKASVSFFMISKEKRKVIFDKWKRDKTSVEYKDVKSVKQGSAEYFKIQAQLKKLGGLMEGGSKSSKKKKDESDDEICVVEEKITDKTRRRAEQRKVLIEKKREQRRREMRALAAKNAGPKTVIKVNSPQGKQLLRKIVATGSVPSSVAKSPPKKFSRPDDDEEEKGLTCPVCFSSFWYPGQTEEHMKTAHNFEKGKPSPSKSKDVKPKLKNAK